MEMGVQHFEEQDFDLGEGGEGEGEGKGGNGNGKRKRGLQAEGYYEWIAWVGEDDSDKGFFEVVRSLGSVVESAGRVKGEGGDK